MTFERELSVSMAVVWLARMAARPGYLDGMTRNQYMACQARLPRLGPTTRQGSTGNLILRLNRRSKFCARGC